MPEPWESEIIVCGDLIQDGDPRFTPEEAEERWNRFVELADEVSGEEGPSGVAAIVSSLKADDDYGAYQSAFSALERFPDEVLGKGVALAAPNLLDLPRHSSGEVLVTVVDAGEDAIGAFGEEMRSGDPSTLTAMIELIQYHESSEWLAEEQHRRKLLMPR